MTLRRLTLAAAVLIAAAVMPVLAQGPVQARIHFTISSPFELKRANVVLPAGHYVLYQISRSDRHLFGLYRDDMTHPPIAMIRTTRIDYVGRWPDKTRMLMDIDEGSPQNYPVLEGWNVPGEDGFEVISVVAKHRRALTRSR